MAKIKTFLKGVSSFLLTNERINTQRCVNQGMDTTRTILDPK